MDSELKRGSELKIFLAEDNSGDAYLIREALSLADLQFTLNRVSDGDEAWAALEEMERQTSPVSLIILDLNLPKISGHELLTKIRQSQQLRTTPVIIITSSDSPADRKKTALLGVTSYFRKPSSLGEFLKFGELVKQVCRDNPEPQTKDASALSG